MTTGGSEYNDDDVLRSEEANEQPVWTILPSYHMYKALYMGMHASTESLHEPPTYEDVLHNSGTTSSIATSSLSFPNSSTVTSSSEPRVIVADETTNDWQNTLLDNTHQLNNLTDSSNKYAAALQVQICFTKEVGKMGKKPTLIDPLVYEYKQGDTVNGHILLENTSTEKIPFDMMYVVFEGSFMVANTKDKNDRKPVKAKLFLQMFDFSASWNHGNIDRLITESSHPYTCPDLVDPVDNTRLAVGGGRAFLPGRRYKRFFTFKIPTQLLDSECGHNLLGHTHIPPSMGVCRDEQAKYSSVQMRALRVRDLSFPETTISYGVMLRIIGRLSMYNVDESDQSTRTKLINSTGDEFVILKDQNEFMRMVPEPVGNSLAEHLMKVTESKMLHDNLLKRAHQKIDIGNAMVRAMRAGNYDYAIDLADQERTLLTAEEHMGDLIKSRQLYRACTSRDTKNAKVPEEEYSVAFAVQKKSLTKAAKPVGAMVVSTRKVNRVVRYISPLRFRPHINDKVDSSTWKLTIPFDFTFTTPGNNPTGVVKPPDVKKLDVELVALTWKSVKYPLPYELNHDIIFGNRVAAHFPLKVDPARIYGGDNINELYKRPFQQISSQLHDLFSEVGAENLKLESQLVEDVRSIACLETKHMNLPVPGVTVSDRATNTAMMHLPWTRKDANTHVLQVNVGVDLETVHLKGEPPTADKAHSKYCLVTSFQSCTIGRLYYLKVVMKLTNNDHVRFFLPITVEKDATFDCDCAAWNRASDAQ